MVQEQEEEEEEEMVDDRECEGTKEIKKVVDV